MTYDGENEPDMLAMIAASAALTLSGVPFMGPIGAARVGYARTASISSTRARTQVAEGELDLVVAGTHDAVMMVESEAKELSEDVMLGAVMFAPRSVAAGDRRDHQARREGRQGAVGAGRSRPTQSAIKKQLKDLDRRRHRRRLQD